MQRIGLILSGMTSQLKATGKWICCVLHLVYLHTLHHKSNPDAAVEDDYDGLDPDIELEMEAFIDEIEEHLMLQDFDPELHQEPKS